MAKDVRWASRRQRGAAAEPLPFQRRAPGGAAGVARLLRM